MKKRNLLGIIALIAIVAFSFVFVACNNDSSSPTCGVCGGGHATGDHPTRSCLACLMSNCPCASDDACTCTRVLPAKPGIPGDATPFAPNPDTNWGIGSVNADTGEQFKSPSLDNGVFSVIDDWNPPNTHRWGQIQFFLEESDTHVDITNATHFVFDMHADYTAGNNEKTMLSDIQNLNVMFRDIDNNWMVYDRSNVRGVFGEGGWDNNRTKWVRIEIPIYGEANANNEARPSILANGVRAIFIQIESTDAIAAPRGGKFYFTNMRFETKVVAQPPANTTVEPPAISYYTVAFDGINHWETNDNFIMGTKHQVGGKDIYPVSDNYANPEAHNTGQINFFRPSADLNIFGSSHFAFDILAQDRGDGDSMLLDIQNVTVMLRTVDKHGNWINFGHPNVREVFGNAGWPKDQWVTVKIPVTEDDIAAMDGADYEDVMSNLRAVFFMIESTNEIPAPGFRGKGLYISNMRFEGLPEPPEPYVVSTIGYESLSNRTSADDDKWEVLNGVGPEFEFKKTFEASGSEDLWTMLRFYRDNDDTPHPGWNNGEATHFVFDMKNDEGFEFWDSFQNMRVRFQGPDGSGGSVDFAVNDIRGVIGDQGWGTGWMEVAVRLSSAIEDGHNTEAALAGVRHVGIRIQLSGANKNKGDNTSLLIKDMRFEFRP